MREHKYCMNTVTNALSGVGYKMAKRTLTASTCSVASRFCLSHTGLSYRCLLAHVLASTVSTSYRQQSEMAYILLPSLAFPTQPRTARRQCLSLAVLSQHSGYPVEPVCPRHPPMHHASF